ncbi:unnamed protein product, partial [Ixodes persulcatus]
ADASADAGAAYVRERSLARTSSALTLSPSAEPSRRLYGADTAFPVSECFCLFVFLFVPGYVCELRASISAKFGILKGRFCEVVSLCECHHSSGSRVCDLFVTRAGESWQRTRNLGLFVKVFCDGKVCFFDGSVTKRTVKRAVSRGSVKKNVYVLITAAAPTVRTTL